MSKTVKKIAGVALPVAAAFVPGIGTLGAAALGAAGGALAGGGVKGALLGAAGGAIGAGALGTTAGAPLVGGVGPTQGTGILGAATRGTGAVSTALRSGLQSGSRILSSLLPSGGGGVSTGGLLNQGANIVGSLIQQQGVSDAASAQRKALSQAEQRILEAEERARTQLQPFAQTGQQSLPQLQALVQDPNAQAQFIQTNPFYQTLANDAERRLLANQAAKGKIGSGETAKALQDQLTLLGSDLLQKQIGNLQGVAQLGQSSATNIAQGALNTGTSLSDLRVHRGNVGAAQRVGGSNALTGGIENILAELTRGNRIYSRA